MSRPALKAWSGRFWSALCQGLAGPGLGLAVQAQLPSQGVAACSPAGPASAAPAARAAVPHRQARALGLRGVQA